MEDTLKIVLKPSVFASKKHLSISPGILEFNDKSLSKFEIAEICYGIKPVYGFRFRIGRIYCIDIRGLTGSTIKIRLQSFYQVNRKKLDEKYKQILHALFENFINDIATTHLKNFNEGMDLEIAGVFFIAKGIRFSRDAEIIEWADLGNRNYWTYYSLYSKSNPHNNRSFYYLTVWNTVVLYMVSRHILNEKGLL